MSIVNWYIYNQSKVDNKKLGVLLLPYIQHIKNMPIPSTSDQARRLVRRSLSVNVNARASPQLVRHRLTKSVSIDGWRNVNEDSEAGGTIREGENGNPDANNN